MTRQDILNKVIKVTGRWGKNTEQSSFEDLDSLDMAEIALHIEQVLNIKFSDDDVDEIRYNVESVKDLVNLVCKKLNISVNNAEIKSNQKLNMLYPIVACMLFAGCSLAHEEENVVVVPGKNKVIVQDIKDCKERLFFTNKNDNRFQYLNTGDHITVIHENGSGYVCDKIFNDDKDVYIYSRDLRAAKQRFQFDSIKKAMVKDTVAQNKR